MTTKSFFNLKKLKNHDQDAKDYKCWFNDLLQIFVYWAKNQIKGQKPRETGDL